MNPSDKQHANKPGSAGTGGPAKQGTTDKPTQSGQHAQHGGAGTSNPGAQPRQGDRQPQPGHPPGDKHR